MAKTKISDLGSSVCVDDKNEKYIPALGNGTAVPGDLVTVAPATGRVAGADVDAGAGERFAGILMESKITGTETAIVTDVPCRIVVPKSGHNYRIRCNIVAAATDEVGGGVTFSATVYKSETSAVTLAATKIGRLSNEALVGDTVCELTWTE